MDAYGNYVKKHGKALEQLEPERQDEPKGQQQPEEVLDAREALA